MKQADYALSVILIVLSAGHGFVGTLAAEGWDSSTSMWSFSGSVAAWMIAAVNILRVGRPADKGVAMVALLGALSWVGLMVWLAVVAHMIADIRIWLFISVAAGLSLFSIRTLRAAA